MPDLTYGRVILCGAECGLPRMRTGDPQPTMGTTGIRSRSEAALSRESLVWLWIIATMKVRLLRFPSAAAVQQRASACTRMRSSLPRCRDTG